MDKGGYELQLLPESKYGCGMRKYVAVAAGGNISKYPTVLACIDLEILFKANSINSAK